MSFTSYSFPTFLALFVLVFSLLPHRAGLLWLLAASCFFYAAAIPKYLVVLFALIAIDYFAGILIEKSALHRKKLFLGVSLFANLGILFTFKYFDFFVTETARVLGFLGFSFEPRVLSLALPLGLSFHTFQSISYVIEVYRGKQKAEKDLLVYSLYVMFWPQLVAGPIERPQNLLPQFHTPRYFNPELFVQGLRLILLGFIKKLVIADRLELYVTTVYNDPTQFSGWPLILATYFFAIQVYCDFSGYSNIASGCANVIGFNLSQNFNSPYLSSSFSEFWKRWHISLSSWFRDYVYIPLGGNKKRVYLNLAVVLLLSGFWHGASWTFIVWGAIHGAFLIFEKLFVRFGICVQNIWIKRIIVFHGFTFALVIFRATSVRQALYIFEHLFWFDHPLLLPINTSFSIRQVCIHIFLALSLLGLEVWNERSPLVRIFTAKPVWVRWAVYYAEVLLIIFTGVFKSSQFIYFHF